MPKILVLEIQAENQDRLSVRTSGPDTSLDRYLILHGYVVRNAANLVAAVDLLATENIELAIIASPQGESNLVEHTKQLALAKPELRMLAVTSLDSSLKSRELIEAGAHDFLARPVRGDELLARLDALRVRNRVAPSYEVRAGALLLNLKTRQVSCGDQVLALTPTEFLLLEALMNHNGSIVNRTTLCQHVWQAEREGLTNVIEVHMNRLRTKLRKKCQAEYIQTIRGKGYALIA